MLLAAETQASFTPTSSSARWPFAANLSEKSTHVTEKTEVLNGLKFEACKGNQNFEYLQDFMDFC